MKRDFLRNLNVPEESIDKIMDENGADIEAAKGNASELQQQMQAKDTEIEGLKGQIAQRDADIAELRKSSEAGATLQQRLDELQTKYNDDTAALQQKLTDQKTEFETTTAMEKFFANVKFSSELAKEAAVSQFRAKGFKLADGTFQGGKEWLEELKKNSPDAFKSDEPELGQLPLFTKSLTDNSTVGNPQTGAGNSAGVFANGWNFTSVRNPNPGK